MPCCDDPQVWINAVPCSALSARRRSNTTPSSTPSNPEQTRNTDGTSVNVTTSASLPPLALPETSPSAPVSENGPSIEANPPARVDDSRRVRRTLVERSPTTMVPVHAPLTAGTGLGAVGAPLQATLLRPASISPNSRRRGQAGTTWPLLWADRFWRHNQKRWSSRQLGRTIRPSAAGMTPRRIGRGLMRWGSSRRNRSPRRGVLRLATCTVSPSDTDVRRQAGVVRIPDQSAEGASGRRGDV